MRLVTRADWDGLVCAVLLSTVDRIDVIQFTSPREIQEGSAAIPIDSIIANLPFHPNAALWFDHHVSEEERGAHIAAGFKGRFAAAPSAARLIYEFHQADDRLKRFADLLEATDRIDSAQLTMDDVVNPSGYVLLAYTLDPRTGLQDLDREAYFLLLLDWLKTKSLDEILALPEVKRLTDRLRADDQAFRQVLQAHSRQDGNVIATDLRGVDAPPGNRFLIYTLFPDANVSARVSDDPGGETCTVSVGHSIFNRTSQANVGRLLAEYGGGGLTGVGSVQFPRAEAESKFNDIVRRLKEAG
jgi:hypothetical protein